MSRECVEALLAGRKPPRLPWVPELNEGFARKITGQAVERKDRAAGRPYWQIEREAARAIGADYLHRVISVRTRRHRVTIERDDAAALTVIHTPAGDLRRVQRWDATSGTVYTREHLVKGPESFAAYVAMVEDETYEPDYDAAAEQIAASDLPTIDVPATPLMHLLMWDMDVQPTLMAMIDETDRMVEMMERVHRKNLEYYRVAAAGPGAILRPMEDTSALLTGPAMYARHCVRHLNEYAEIAHQAGKLFIPHMCGHLDGMIGVLRDVALDGIEAITPPPLGNADLARMRRDLGDIWLLGGVDPSMYARGSRAEMVAHVRHTLEVMRGDRRFLLNHEEIPLAARWENVQAVADLVAATAEGFYA